MGCTWGVLCSRHLARTIACQLLTCGRTLLAGGCKVAAMELGAIRLKVANALATASPESKADVQLMLCRWAPVIVVFLAVLALGNQEFFKSMDGLAGQKDSVTKLDHADFLLGLRGCLPVSSGSTTSAFRTSCC